MDEDWVNDSAAAEIRPEWREQLRQAREEAVGVREHAADERAELADERQELAEERDRLADRRERVANQRQAVANQREKAADRRDGLDDERARALAERESELDAREAHVDDRARAVGVQTETQAERALEAINILGGTDRIESTAMNSVGARGADPMGDAWLMRARYAVDLARELCAQASCLRLAAQTTLASVRSTRYADTASAMARADRGSVRERLDHGYQPVTAAVSENAPRQSTSPTATPRSFEPDPPGA